MSLTDFDMSIPLESGFLTDFSGYFDCLNSLSGMKVILVTSMNSSTSTSGCSWLSSLRNSRIDFLCFGISITGVAGLFLTRYVVTICYFSTNYSPNLKSSGTSAIITEN